MARKRDLKPSKHHVYPKKWRNNGDTEIKIVTERDHRLWHALTDDEQGQATHPVNAMRILAEKFLPQHMEIEFAKVIESSGRKN